MKWVMAVDRQIQCCTSFPGLVAFRPEDNSEMWAPENWRRWPGCSFSLDQGGDGLTAVHSLMYKSSVALNTFVTYDWVHGGKNDLIGALKATGKYALCLLALVCMNLPHGPDKDQGMRYNQIRGSMETLFSTGTPEGSPIFLQHAPEIIREVRRVSPEAVGDGGVESLWAWLKEREPFECKGTLIKMCEFRGWLAGCSSLVDTWYTRKFQLEYVAVEADLLSTTKFKQTFMPSLELQAHQDAIESTSRKITQVDAKMVRSACGNNVMTSVVMLNNINFFRQLCVICRVAGPLGHWQGHAQKVMKKQCR